MIAHGQSRLAAANDDRIVLLPHGPRSISRKIRDKVPLLTVRPALSLARVVSFGRVVVFLAIAETTVRVAGWRRWRRRRRRRWCRRSRRCRGCRSLHLRRYGLERSPRGAAE